MIPMLDLKAQYRALEKDLHVAMQDVLESGEFIFGKAVAELEAGVAAYCGVRHGVGLASGTDALRLMFAALDLKPGDEVITTPFTFVATANTITHAGAKPVFVDIDPTSFNIDPEAVRAAIGPRTRCILPVHLFGQPAEMDALHAAAQRHRISVVEDAAQAIGAEYRGRRAGSLARAATFSFYPTKNLGAYGDAGMVVTDDAGLASELDVLRRQGGKRRYYAEKLGFNSRLDTLQAAILLVKLRHLEAWNEGRRRVAARYDRELEGTPVTTPKPPAHVRHVYHQYTVRAPDRDRLAAHLRARGVASMVYYPVPLHLQPLYHDLGLREGSLPHAEKAAAEVLSLPMYPELTTDDQDRVVSAIREFYA